MVKQRAGCRAVPHALDHVTGQVSRSDREGWRKDLGGRSFITVNSCWWHLPFTRAASSTGRVPPGPPLQKAFPEAPSLPHLSARPCWTSCKLLGELGTYLDPPPALHPGFCQFSLHHENGDAW